MKDLATKDGHPLSISEKIDIMVQAGLIPRGVPPAQISVYSELCSRVGLDPFSRDAYLIKYGGTYQTMFSFSGYLHIANTDGDFAGVDPVLYDGMPLHEFVKSGGAVPVSASCTVWKMVQGNRVPFTADVLFSEYTTKGGLWVTKPLTMIKKVATVHALRLAFPAKLRGTYIEEEMEAGIMDVQQQEDEAKESVTQKSNAATQAAMNAIKRASGQQTVEDVDAEEVVDNPPKSNKLPFE